MLLLAVVLVASSGCGTVNRMFRNPAAEERAAALLQLQLGVMRYADEYSARVGEQVLAWQQAGVDARMRLSLQAWLVSQSTAARTLWPGSGRGAPSAGTWTMVVLSAS